MKEAAKISVISSAISILAALLLVSRYGAVGLAAGMAVTQLIFNCGWFTWAACRVSGTSPSALLRALFAGLAWPLAALAAEILISRAIWTYLSSLWLVIVAAVAGLIYLALWGLYTALPLYRGCTEVAAR